uniref:Uncharacterized protein n=1 Tax=Nucleocytoviricota sp. TaxID=2809609 RepID=A0A9E8JWX8_9VIRU|nr:hypothetical protein [Nucleocytoviricota sp.]UZT29265.1 hypothetical protein [Nucleocytoviricota sp.]
MHVSSISKLIINFIDNLKKFDKNIILFNNEINNNENQYNKVKKFLKKFYEIFIISNKYINKFFVKQNNLLKLNNNYYTTIKNFNYEMENYLNSRFIGKNKNKIMKIVNKKKEIKLDDLHIKFFYNNKSEYEIDKLIYNLILLFNIVKKLFSIKERKINLIIFYCDIKKEHYFNKSIIDYENMNSGISYYNNIILFRKEEILKVFIHELLHNFGLDNLYDNSNIKLTQIFKINSDNLFNEAYIEFIAIILHTIYFSCLFSENYSTMNYYFKIFINYEINFSLIQLVKFLNIYNIEFLDFFKKNNYRENTNTFSYIYLKFLLIFNYNYFLNNIISYNNISIYKEDYIIYYLKYFNNKGLLIFLNNLTNNFKENIKIYCKKKPIICKSNRLSICEINF